MSVGVKQKISPFTLGSIVITGAPAAAPSGGNIGVTWGSSPRFIFACGDAGSPEL